MGDRNVGCDGGLTYSNNGVVHINEVTLSQSRLVLRRVMVLVNRPGSTQPPSFRGREMSTGQEAVAVLCG